MSARLYRDCRPTCLETARLQKGLVLLLDGKELIEEGVGFGAPVVKYKDKTYFSGSAKCCIRTDENRCTLTKSFVLDTISRKRLGTSSYINDKLYHFLHRAFEIVYLNYQGLAQASNRIMALQKSLGIQTEFIKVKPRGTVTFKYSFSPNEIQVIADMKLLNLDRCKNILIHNEQGASFFNRYSDSTGLALSDHKIGAWTKITSEEASFSNTKQTLTFALKNNAHVALLRGWEKTLDRFSWAGFAYSLPPINSAFHYAIELGVEEKT